MQVAFCTYFDSGYLTRALALHESLVTHAPGCVLYAVCMDLESFNYLQERGRDGLVPISRSEFEEGDHELVATQKERSVVEYYFTCTPSVPLFVLRRHPEIDIIFYVDADLFFFSSITSMLDDVGCKSIYIVEHRFPESLKALAVYGRFNVGILGFRNNSEGWFCLKEWRRDCLEWCFDRLEGDRFGDQKYLDSWPGRFEHLQIATHPGVNLAPWNKQTHTITFSNESMNADGVPIVCYHFQGLRLYDSRIIEPQALDYGAALTNEMLCHLYIPYVLTLLKHERLFRIKSQARRYGKAPTLARLWEQRRSPQYAVVFCGMLLPLSGAIFWLTYGKIRIQVAKSSLMHRLKSLRFRLTGLEL